MRNRSTNAPDRLPADDRSLHILAEQVRMVYRQTPIGVIATVVNAGILAALLGGYIANVVLTVWLGAIALVVVLRSALMLSYRHRRPPPDRARFWGRLNTATLMLSGIIWGAAAIFLFPVQSVAHQLFVGMLLCGMVAGALGAFTSMLSAFAAFTVPALMPLIIRLWTFTDPLHLSMGAVTLIFLVLSTMTARHISSERRQIIAMRETLAQRVRRRTRELEKANRRLETEVGERRQIEAELRKERDLLETITGNIGAGLAVITRDYRTQWANRVLKDLFGDVEGRSCFATYNRQSEICPGCGVRAIFEDDRQEVVHEQQGRDRDGNAIWSQIVATAIRDENNRTVAALELVLPITERKKAETEREQMLARIEQARKFEAISTLAGGIAHQFNNALSVIIGNLELLQHDHPGLGGLHRQLDPITAACRQMTHLTDQLLAYAKGGRYHPQAVTVREFIERSLPLTRHLHGDRIRLDTDIGVEPVAVHIDRTQLQMVLSALITNAAEAIDGSGTITVATRSVDIAPGHAVLAPGPYARLSVSDTGKGMDEATCQRIFEPFFTTKFQGRGLAMAAVYGIVKNHGGYISVASRPGEGTDVSIDLPAVAVPEPARSQRWVPALASAGGDVLVVEDEDMVAQVNRALLERLGYRVSVADTGTAAVSLLTSDAPLDLILLDVRLPDMDAAAVLDCAMAHRPATPVLLCSGFALDRSSQQLLDAGARGFLQKPFSLAQLAEEIRRVIAAETAPEDPGSE